ncbi:MAG: hypothetical protein IKJ94_03005 [Oscillospiraceae bacterium]|nr:hypothetical protein [Oscillospiraceae bacterium]
MTKPRKKLDLGKCSVLLRWGILAAALVLTALGFLTGGTQDVMTKAINICSECIGLG